MTALTFAPACGYPADADVWSFRRDWAVEKRRMQDDQLAGDFRFGLLDRITLGTPSLPGSGWSQHRTAQANGLNPDCCILFVRKDEQIDQMRGRQEDHPQSKHKTKPGTGEDE
jgi:hypothetical protein